MKRQIFILMHKIAVRLRTYHAKQLSKWTEFDNKICSK